MKTKTGWYLYLLTRRGNGFRKFDGFGESAATDYDGDFEIRAEALTKEMKEQGYTEEDVFSEDEESFPVLVLWP